MSSVTPFPNEVREGIAQQDLTTLIGERPDLLRLVPWVRPKDGQGRYTGPRKGVLETLGYERTALINDFCRHDIPIQVRLDVDMLQELYLDPEMTELEIAGPHATAWAMPSRPLPDQVYVIDGTWRDYNAFFANWLNHVASENPDFGAEYSRFTWEDVIVGGQVTKQRVEQRIPPRKLFEWRTQADALASGQRDSGLYAPPQRRAARVADEPMPEGVDAASIDNSAVTGGGKKGR